MNKPHALRATVLGVAMLSGLLAACGGSDDSGGGSSSITIGVISDETSPGASAAALPYMGASARAQVEQLNADGGLDGHKVKVITCDAKVDPNVTTNCARQMVSEHAAVVYGYTTLAEDRILQVLEAAGIPFLPLSAAIPADFNSKVSFPFGAGASIYIGMGVAAAQNGCKDIAFVSNDTPAYDTLYGYVNAGVKSEGGPEPKKIKFAPSTTDYAPLAAEITSGGFDCMVGVASANQAIGWGVQLQKAGSHIKVFGDDGNTIGAESIAAAHTFFQGATSISLYPPFADPAWDPYKATLDKYSDPSKYAFGTNGSRAMYIGFQIFKQLGSQILADGGQVTAKTMLKSLSGQKALTVKGFIPELDMTSTSNIKGYPRLFNTNAVFNRVDGDAAKPLPGGPVDLTKAYDLLSQ
jgi:ABC-type branched-subunit amino acid transport system substrate-binding protein